MVRSWCRVVAWALNIHSYLLGDNDKKESQEGEQNGNNQQQNQPEVGAGLGAVHQALFMMEPPIGNTIY